MNDTVKSDDPISELARRFISAWAQLYPDPGTGRPGDAGARAALRRAATPVEVLMQPAFHALLRQMKEKEKGQEWQPPNDWQMRRLAIAASVLAQRRDAGTGWRPKADGQEKAARAPSFMQRLGGSPEKDERRLSPLRFQALMAAMDRRDGEESLTALRRVMPLVADVDFNLYAFVTDLLRWSDTTRIRWTFEYFGSAPPEMITKSVPDETPAAEEISA